MNYTFETDNEIRLMIGADMTKELALFNKVNHITNQYRSVFGSFTEEEFEKAYELYKDSEKTKELHAIATAIEIKKEYFVYNEEVQTVWFNSELFATSNSSLATIFHFESDSISKEQHDKLIRLLISKVPIFVEKDVTPNNLEEVFLESLTEEEKAEIGEEHLNNNKFLYYSFGIIFSLRKVDTHIKNQIDKVENAPQLFTVLFHYYSDDQYALGTMKYLRYLTKHPNENISSEDLYSFWRSGYQLNEQNFKSMQEGFYATYNAQYPSVKKRIEALKPLCDKKGMITIYRGETNYSLSHKEALSWTLSKNVACSFAFRNKAEHYTLVEAKVHIDHIYDTLIHDSELKREELEVLVNPKRVKVVDTVTVEDTKSVITSLSTVKAPPTSLNFGMSYGQTYFDVFKSALETLSYYENEIDGFFECSDLHGFGHTKRVLLHAITNFYHYKDSYKLKGADLDILIASAMFHDIGRVHDEEDYLHGEQSVEKMTELGLHDELGLSGEELEITKFIMATHNIPDKLAYERLKETNIRDKKRAKMLYGLLCDADNLDRVRLGDLNITYLRNDKAKLSVEYAGVLLKQL